MTIKEMANKEVYHKFLNYIFEKCNIVSLSHYCNIPQPKDEKILNYILSTMHYSKEGIIELYSDSFLKQVYQQFKNDPYIFDEEYQKTQESSIPGLTENQTRQMQNYDRRMLIQRGLIRIHYDHVVTEFLKKYEGNMISKKSHYYNRNRSRTDYSFHLTEELKTEFFARNSIEEWDYPNALENIFFYKDNECYFAVITHEKMYEIYCETKESYEFLKSIGIEFIDDEFIENDLVNLIR